MSEELKPCPFCGGKATLATIKPHTHFIAEFLPRHPGSCSVECSKCNCGIIFDEPDARDKVTAAWNTRPPAVPVEALEEWIVMAEKAHTSLSQNATWANAGDALTVAVALRRIRELYDQARGGSK